MSRTPYAETEALLALMESRSDDVDRIVGAMTAREQRDLQAHLRDLDRIVGATEPTTL